MSRRFAALIVAALLLSSGCRSAQAPEESPQQAAPVMLVTAATAAIAPIRNTLRVLGTTVATHHVTIRSPASGRVTGISLKNGDMVRKGQVIGYVINREIEAARAGLAIARGIEPDQAAELEQSVNRYAKGAGIPIVAPESGVVFRPPVASGQMVADLDPIAELVDPASIYVEASIPVDKLHLISPGMNAIVTSGLDPGASFSARVGALIPSFNAGGATAPIRLDFTGPESIREIGAPVEAHIVIATDPHAIVIPESALFQDLGDNRYHVFVAGADEIARRVPVAVGIRDGTEVQILSGLKAGDRVITSGGYALSDGLRVRIATGTES